ILKLHHSAKNLDHRFRLIQLADNDPHLYVDTVYPIDIHDRVHPPDRYLTIFMKQHLPVRAIDPLGPMTEALLSECIIKRDGFEARNESHHLTDLDLARGTGDDAEWSLSLRQQLRHVQLAHHRRDADPGGNCPGTNRC